MSEETGLNVVWVPRLDVIAQLVAAQGETDRNAVLIDRRDDILTDTEACLSEVTHGDVADDVQLARSAVAAVRDGYEAPGRALAASVLSGLVHTAFAFRRFAVARERFIRDDPDCRAQLKWQGSRRSSGTASRLRLSVRGPDRGRPTRGAGRPPSGGYQPPRCRDGARAGYALARRARVSAPSSRPKSRSAMSA
jgi:hypothetical protein